MNNSEEEKNRKWIIETVGQGMRSEYWKILKKAIQEWAEGEKRVLSYYNSTLMTTQNDIDKHNRAIQNLEYLNHLLTINETIVNHHLSLLEKVKKPITEFFNESRSFVKEIFK